MTIVNLIKARMEEGVPFARHVGVSIDDIGVGTSCVSLDATPERLNHLGSLHAGALFTLGETASGAAMAGALGWAVLTAVPVASNARITYRRVAEGNVMAKASVSEPAAKLVEKLSAEGVVQFSVHVSLTDESRAEIAVMEVDWHVRRRKDA